MLKIKDICSAFFDKIDSHSKRVTTSIEEIEKTFEKWKNDVMKPAQSTEARLFAVEAQVYETENERVAEFHYMKDIMKKLVFAIE